MHDETNKPGAGGSLSVFVVEDEFLIAMDVEMMLEQNGHAVIATAPSVENALRLLEEARPDVALLDMNLRGELVFPVAERLRSLNIPFVLASAYGTVDFEGGEAVADAENIGKPINERRLLDALRRAVGQG
ncbi:Response regulator receiver domain-containing protein [Palleronia marisminoris]|uniref:Transcriptional regulatory protein AfsQ1 n=1 Tax=Palleronia marisminoris TaxID=315423 RepID=A0A1Y5S5X2_9RHOB|nr:response regulator [Palleronia marisminoris]SFG64246.1 Response regulator receiver domain-containing protein [Palleronia marisminoris]SLN33310.1 Transcriptional regulatory protein AfsQ1 [Palleronia marisminoris]